MALTNSSPDTTGKRDTLNLHVDFSKLGVRRQRLAMLHHAFDVRGYRFLDIEQRFLPVAALRVASGKRGATGDYNAAFVFRKGYYELHFVSRSFCFAAEADGRGRAA